MQLIWYGHSAYRLEFGSSVVLIDPFLTGNSGFKGSVEEASRGATHILLTHAHADHVGDTVAIAGKTGAKVVANFELCSWLAKKGVKATDPMNTGGTTDQGDFAVSLTIAFHSSAEADENGAFQALGLPNGIVITPRNGGGPVVYHMGDTEIFGDMGLINEIYTPRVVMVPIGDRFTMGPRTAAMAVKRFLPHARKVLPCHYGTFPPLVQSPDAFIEAMGAERSRVEVPRIGVAITL